jgi:hypothetical protein
MKRAAAIGLMILLLGLSACGKAETEDDPQNNGSAYIANPWRDVSEAEAVERCPDSFGAPAGAKDVRWSVMDSAADASGNPGALVQLSFELDGLRFTAREQLTGETQIDQSGMYYSWSAQKEDKLRIGADEIACRSFRYVGADEYADLCTWFLADPGVSCSVSVRAEDLDGFDLLAVAEALYR